MSCLILHQKHEWIPDTDGWIWIISPQSDKKDFSIFYDKKIENLPFALSSRGTWYNIKNTYFKHHCTIYHPEYNSPGGKTSFKPHTNLYSQFFPNHFLALIDENNHSNFKFIDATEYQAEEKWIKDDKTVEIDNIFDMAKQIYSPSKPKVLEEGYTNYEVQDGINIVLPLLGALFGTFFIIYVLYYFPNGLKI